MKAVAKEFAGRATVVKVDISRLFGVKESLREKFRIEGLPMMLIFKDGREVGRLEGADQTTKDRVRSALLEALGEES